MLVGGAVSWLGGESMLVGEAMVQIAGKSMLVGEGVSFWGREFAGKQSIF